MMIAMQKFLRKGIRPFVKGDDGLVTVEWVALAAAVVVGGISLVWLVLSNLKAPAATIGTQINGVAAQAPGPSPFP